jgi:hypothetical protein
VVEYCLRHVAYQLFGIEEPWRQIREIITFERSDEPPQGGGGLNQLVKYGASDTYLSAKRICDQHVQHL